MLSSPEHTHLSHFSNQTAEMLKLCSAEAMTSRPSSKNMPEGSDLQNHIHNRSLNGVIYAIRSIK